MALIKITPTITSPSILASSSGNFEEVIVGAMIICKAKVTPSIPGGTFRLFIYEDSARTKLVYKTDDVSRNPFYDPSQEEDGTVTEQRRGLIGVAEDESGAKKLYFTINNGDSGNAKTYGILIDYIDLVTPLGFRFGALTTGAVNGANKIFTMPSAHNPLHPIFLKVKSQTLEENGNGYQFTRAGLVLTLGANVTAPATGDPQPRVSYVEL